MHTCLLHFLDEYGRDRICLRDYTPDQVKKIQTFKTSERNRNIQSFAVGDDSDGHLETFTVLSASDAEVLRRHIDAFNLGENAALNMMECINTPDDE